MRQLYIKFIFLVCLNIILLTACSSISKNTSTTDITFQDQEAESRVITQENKGNTFIAKVVKVIDGLSP